MNRDEAKALAKENLEPYLREKGIDPTKPFRCLNPAHEDKHPSMSFDRKRNAVHCFSCNADYDIFNLVAIDNNTDAKGAFELTYRMFGIQLDEPPKRGNDIPPSKSPAIPAPSEGEPSALPKDRREETKAYLAACAARICETDYHRGLSLATLQRHGVGFDPHFRVAKKDRDAPDEWQALIIPTGDGRSFVARNTDPISKDRYRNRGRAALFNPEALREEERPVFVVEGEIDAMSVEEAGGIAVGLGSMTNGKLLLDAAKLNPPKQLLIIALDHEKDAQKAKKVASVSKQIADSLRSIGVRVCERSGFGGFHDANEALTYDRNAFASWLAETEREAVETTEAEEARVKDEELAAYRSEICAGECLAGFRKRIKEEQSACVPTGFSGLDDVLDGGFPEGLVVIGAMPSFGKTTLALQIGDQIAKRGYNVLIFSLEMSRDELLAKSISRLTCQLELAKGKQAILENAKSSRKISEGWRYDFYRNEELKLIEEAFSAYGAFASRIFIREGVGVYGPKEIREAIDQHIRLTGNHPLVIVDYLQVAAAQMELGTEKQQVDRAITDLKRASRDCHVTILAISSFNRAGYKQEATFEQFKESGGIEYGADIVFSLQFQGAGEKNFDTTAAKRADPRKVELVVLKNRQGKVGEKVPFDYYPRFNYFEERQPVEI